MSLTEEIKATASAGSGPDGAVLPEAAPVHELIQRLVDVHGAQWIAQDELDAWKSGPGTRVLMLAGNPQRHPEVLDVAVVLPELARHFKGQLQLGLARAGDEEAIARRFDSWRWPALVFFRDGGFIETLHGMLDWDDFVKRVSDALVKPASRPPGIGIPLVQAQSHNNDCH